MKVTATPSNDVTSGHVVNVTSSVWAESTGELLWLWYVVFTVVLLALILASFVRFHYKRGQQQKQRLDAEMTYTVKRHHVTPSASFSNHAMTPAAVVNLDTQKLLTSQPSDVRGYRRSRGREDGDVKRAPVVYMFNANGSMVDVRCQQVEICNTFRFDNGYHTDDPQHIHLHSRHLDLDDLKDIDESRQQRSCLKSSHDPLTSTSLGHAVDGDLPQSNHHPHSSQQHLLPHHRHHRQAQQQLQQQQHHRQRQSPLHHRYRHRHATSSSATRTSLLHPSRFGREYLASDIISEYLASSARNTWRRDK